MDLRGYSSCLRTASGTHGEFVTMSGPELLDPQECLTAMDGLIESLRELNNEPTENHGWRSRELSVAITNTETARLWMLHAFAMKGLNLR
jgi:hypothetical protein